MKKHIKAISMTAIAAFIFIACICVSSCQSDNEPLPKEDTQEELAFQELHQQLASYSSEFLASHPQSDASRNSWDDFWYSVRSDFTGGGISFYNGKFWVHIIGSIGRSYQTWKRIRYSNIVPYNNLSDTSLLIIDSKLEYYNYKLQNTDKIFPYNYVQIAGALHNIAILNQLKQDYFNYDLTNALFFYNSVLIPYGNNLDDRNLKDIEEDIILYTSLQEIQNNDEYFNTLIDLEPAMSMEYTLLKEFSSTASKIRKSPDMDEYAKQTQNLVEYSNVPLHSKEYLKCCLSIAMASFDLWSTIDGLK